jgi:hypothetical protein
VAALDIGRLEVQRAIQLAVKAAPMRCDRAVGAIGPPVLLQPWRGQENSCAQVAILDQERQNACLSEPGG